MSSSLSPKRIVRSISERLSGDNDDDDSLADMVQDNYYDLTFDSNKKKKSGLASKLPKINMNFFTEPHRYDDVARNEYDIHVSNDDSLENIDDHDDSGNEHVELVDEEAISIMSKRRLRAQRAKRTMCGMACISAILLVVGATISAIRTNHIDITKFVPTIKRSGIGANEKTVKRLCKQKAIDQHGTAPCQEACLVASCCHATAEEDNCYAEFPDFCAEFIACNILHDGPDIPTTSKNDDDTIVSDEVLEVMPPPSDLDHQCHPTRLNSSLDATKACKSACGSATCCFPSANDDNCFLRNQLLCSEYAACKHLFNEQVGPAEAATAAVKDDAASSPVVQACQADKVQDPTQRQVCFDLCESYQCCFTSELNASCGADCSGWGAPCAILFQQDNLDQDGNLNDDGAVDTEFADTLRLVTDLCGPPVDLTDINQREECEEACALAENCCKTSTPHCVSCDAYIGCDRLNQSLEDHIFNVCERNDDRTACADACRVAECCYDPHHPNSCRTEQWCEPYGGCYNLVAVGNGFDSDGATAVDTTTSSTSTTSSNVPQMDGMKLTGEINRMCADISFSSGVDDCFEICHPSQCCFNDEIQCADELQTGCDPYAACQVLVGTTDFASSSSSGAADPEISDGMQLTGKVNRMCKDITFPTAREDCLDVCRPSECCFNSDIPCSTDLQLGCDAYSACHVLIGTTQFANLADESQSTSTNNNDDDPKDGMKLTGKVNRICNDITYPTAREDCIDVCRPAACCFNNNLECSDELIGCDPYTSCHVLLSTTDYAKSDEENDDTTDISSTSPETDGMALTGRVNRLCNDMKYPTAREDCIDVCRPSECCFNSDIPCPDELDSCDPYTSCHVLIGLTQFAVKGNDNSNSNINQNTNQNTSDSNNNNNKGMQMVWETKKEEAKPPPVDTSEADAAALTAKVTELCADITDSLAEENCIDVCRPAECCFNNHISCPSDLTGCDPYANCQILVDETKFAHLEGEDDDSNEETVVDWTQDAMLVTGKVNQMCADITYPTAEEDCIDICQPAACCFNDAITCPQDLVGCDPYAACKVLLDKSKYAQLPTDQQEEEENEPPMEDAMTLTGRVNQMCEDIRFPTAEEDCIDICRPSACCFNSAISCPQELVGCDPYTACTVLVGKTKFAQTLSDESEQQPPQEVDAMVLTGRVNTLCADIKYPTAEEDCIDICRPSECCFNDAISCPNDLVGCDPYAACKVLVEKTQFAHLDTDGN